MGSAPQFCQELSKALKESQWVRSICVLIGNGAERGLAGVASRVQDNGCAALVCSPRSARLGPLMNDMPRSSSKARDALGVEPFSICGSKRNQKGAWGCVFVSVGVWPIGLNQNLP